MKTINLEVTDEIYEKHMKEMVQEMERVKSKEEKKIHIKNRLGEIIYTSTKTTMKEAVEEAVLRGADLSGADLTRVNLSGADLTRVNLSRADLSGADLTRVNLTRADLSEADLTRADLSEAELYRAQFYGKGGQSKLRKNQVEDFLKALGFIVVD